MMQPEAARAGRAARVVVLFTLLAVLLPSCETSSNYMGGFSGGVPDEELTYAEVEMRAQAEDFDTNDFDATVAAGCFAGAVTGALIGALLSSTGSRGSTAALGAAAGIAAGCGSGYYVANRKASYAQAESEINVLIDDAQAQSDELARMIATTELVIQQNREEIAYLREQYDQGLASSDSMELQIRKVRENREVIEETVANLEKRIKKMTKNVKEYQQANQGAYVGQLVREIEDFESKKEAMEALLVRMDEFVESIELEDPLG